MLSPHRELRLGSRGDWLGPGLSRRRRSGLVFGVGAKRMIGGPKQIYSDGERIVFSSGDHARDVLIQRAEELEADARLALEHVQTHRKRMHSAEAEAQKYTSEAALLRAGADRLRSEVVSAA